MTTYHLKYWTKATGRTSNPLIAASQIERIYVNADDRSSLGYFERRTSTAERGNASYYDRHRSAKGDTVETAERYSSTVPAAAEAAILKAAGIDDGDDEWGRFATLTEHARGVRWVGTKKTRGQTQGAGRQLHR